MAADVYTIRVHTVEALPYTDPDTAARVIGWLNENGASHEFHLHDGDEVPSLHAHVAVGGQDQTVCVPVGSMLCRRANGQWYSMPIALFASAYDLTTPAVVVTASAAPATASGSAT